MRLRRKAALQRPFAKCGRNTACGSHVLLSESFAACLIPLSPLHSQHTQLPMHCCTIPHATLLWEDARTSSLLSVFRGHETTEITDVHGGVSFHQTDTRNNRKSEINPTLWVKLWRSFNEEDLSHLPVQQVCWVVTSPYTPSSNRPSLWPNSSIFRFSFTFITSPLKTHFDEICCF